MSTDKNIPAEGDILAGKYRVERVLGQGGMGVVVAAMHLVLGQRVAIKFLLQNATPEVVARFLREARAAVRLKNEHVARVLDVGELPNGAPYMVMEYLDGGDLAHVVRSRGPLPIAEAIDYVLQACEGVSEAHSLGIIHRDLKPANLFLTTASDGSSTVKVLDFGISKTLEEPSEDGDDIQLTKTTAVLGSPLYMSPEQLRSARGVTTQSDLWSIGAILYQLLTGKVPFNANAFSDLVLMVYTQTPPPLATVRPDVPPPLEAAILRCLEKSREARFANAGELAWAIADFGPPDAYTRAERISRTLEMAGLTVTRPPGVVVSLAGGPMSRRGPMSQPAVTSSQGSMPGPLLLSRPGPLTASHPGPAAVPQPGPLLVSQSGPTAVSQPGPLAASQQGAVAQAALAASQATLSGATQATLDGNPAAGVAARPPKRGLVVVGALVALLAVAGGAVAMVMRGGGPPSDAGAASPSPSQPAATGSLTPVVLPASAATRSDTSTTAPPSTVASAAVTAPAPAAPRPADSPSPTPVKTAPAVTTTKKKNPLDLQIAE